MPFTQPLGTFFMKGGQRDIFLGNVFINYWPIDGSDVRAFFFNFVQNKLGIRCIAKKQFVNVTVNTLDAVSTTGIFRFTIGFENFVSIPAGLTGLFESANNINLLIERETIIAIFANGTLASSGVFTTENIITSCERFN